MTPTVGRGARHLALLAGVPLVGLAVERWGTPAVFTRRGLTGRRDLSPRRDALTDPSADAWDEAAEADVASAERNDRYAG